MTDAQTPAEHVLDVTGANGTPFRLILDPSAADYKGRIAGSVAFYDRRWNHTPHGQKVSSYYPTELIDGRSAQHGLDLSGDVDAWKIPAPAMALVTAWLEAQTTAYAAANSLRLQTRDETKPWEVRVLVPVTS